MTPAGCTVSTAELGDAVNRVFALFKAHWPRKFPSIWKSEAELANSKRSWLAAFQQCAHLTPETLRAGLDRVRSLSWPPDNPGEFLALCHVQPQAIGAPDEDAAFKEACRNAYPFAGWKRWSHKVVYWAAVWTGLGDLNERGEKVRKKFNENYQQALDQVDTLDDAPAAQLPDRAQQVEPDLEGEGYLEFKEALKNLKGMGDSDED